MKIIKNNQTACPGGSSNSRMTPTQMIREFRVRVLNGECPLPFSEGATPEQQREHATKIRLRAEATR